MWVCGNKAPSASQSARPKAIFPLWWWLLFLHFNKRCRLNNDCNPQFVQSEEAYALSNLSCGKCGTTHSVLPFFTKSFLFPTVFYNPFSWPHKDKVMWQSSHNWKCCGTGLKLPWWWRGAQPCSWRPGSEPVLAHGFALTALEPCSLSEFGPESLWLASQKMSKKTVLMKLHSYCSL